jgi:hypothetical protein
MAINLSVEVEKLEKYVRAGMEDGPDPIVKNINLLFNRIKELENALIPFARVGLRDNNGLPLTQVYHKDCQTAVNKLSLTVAKAHNPPPVEEYLPAE